MLERSDSKGKHSWRGMLGLPQKQVNVGVPRRRSHTICPVSLARDMSLFSRSKHLTIYYMYVIK